MEAPTAAKVIPTALGVEKIKQDIRSKGESFFIQRHSILLFDMNPQHSYITNEISLVFSCLFLEQLMGEQMLSGNEDSSTISQQGKHGHMVKPPPTITINV